MIPITIISLISEFCKSKISHSLLSFFSSLIKLSKHCPSDCLCESNLHQTVTFFSGEQESSNCCKIQLKFIFMESSSNANVLYTFLPLGPMQVNSMLDFTLSDFLVFSVAVMYSISSCFHSSQSLLMLPLKLSSCGGLNLSIPD